MPTYSLHQRWFSKTEPELGLGYVSDLNERMVQVTYTSKDVVRSYEITDAPLKRAKLSVGALAESRDGERFTVTAVANRAGDLLTYRGENHSLDEEELADTQDFSNPLIRLKAGQCDNLAFYQLRQMALDARRQLLSSPTRGFHGGKIQLFPHQLHIASQVCKRHRVRVLLADEVGLGKTIEAALIMHRLVLTGRARRVLILVPPSLQHQWFCELFLRFNLSFTIIDEDYVDDHHEDLDGLFEDAQCYICPQDFAPHIPLAEKSWDLVCVDEAHRIENESDAMEQLEELSRNAPHLLLLSATPEQSGDEGHFNRLALLDPSRFHDLESYREEQQSYTQVAGVAAELKSQNDFSTEAMSALRGFLHDPTLEDTGESDWREQTLQRLLDQHGIGRLMFRNARKTIGGFPRRETELIPLKGKWNPEDNDVFMRELEGDEDLVYENIKDHPKTKWLIAWLKENIQHKILLICANTAKTEALYTYLRRASDFRIAKFHHLLSLIEQDRQAAWFQDPEGAQLLVSSPLGAEGRNFQCASHLVLFDLPRRADQLEQRIGRLDRIGQGEVIHIKVPFVEDSSQERIARWFDKGLEAFAKPWHGATKIEDEFEDAFYEYLEEGDDAILDQLHERNNEILAELESGRDKLLEYNSFDESAAGQLSSKILEGDRDPALEALMSSALESFGIDLVESDKHSYVLKPNDFYTLPFPGFKEDGMSVSFERTTALQDARLHFLNWDHPMVRDGVELLISAERGNASIVRTTELEPGLVLETTFVVFNTLPSPMRADRFLPPTPMQLAVNKEDQKVDAPISPDILEKIKPQLILGNEKVVGHIDHMLEACRKLAEEESVNIIDAAIDRMNAELEPEYQRLVDLQKVNPSISDDEIEAARNEIDELEEGLSNIAIRLDSVRLVACYPKKH